LPAALAGFTLAHAAWSLSDTDDGEPLCPLAVIEQHDGARRLVRFEVGSDHPGDVLAIDFWAPGVTGAATLTQPFNRAINGARFRIGARPTLLVGHTLLSADVALPYLETIMAGVRAHTVVAEL